MADERLEIELTLDDGLIKKGFAVIKKEGQKTAETFGDQFKKEFLRGIGLGAGAFGAAKIFQGITDAFGGVVNTFKEGITAAQQQEDAINSLNTSLKLTGTFSEATSQSLQAFASRLQENSRFGDEVILQNAALLQSLANLDSGGLKRATQASADLAEAIGIDLNTAITLVGKSAGGEIGTFSRYGLAIQRGKTNAETFENVLRTVEDRFSGAAASKINTYSGAITQLSNNWGDFLEGLGDLIIKNPVVLELIKGLSDAVKGFADNLKTENVARFGSGIEQLEAKTKLTRDELTRLRANLASLGPTTQLQATDKIAKLTAELSSLEKQLEKAQLTAIKFKEKAPGLGLEPPDPSKVEAFNKKIIEQTMQLNSQRIDAALAAAQRQEDIERITAEKKLDIENQTNFKIAELRKQAEELQLQDTIAFNNLIQAVREDGNIKKEAAEQRMLENSKKVSDAIRSSLVSGIVSSTKALVDSLGKGAKGFEKFGLAILSIIGDMAISVGATLIGIGIGMEAVRASIVGLTGGPALFAGIALVALGALLKSLSGGSEGGVAGATPQTGGSAGTTDTTSPTGFNEVDERQRQTAVSVNINGDVFDTKETGLRIADILTEHFDTSNGILAT